MIRVSSQSTLIYVDNATVNVDGLGQLSKTSDQ